MRNLLFLVISSIFLCSCKSPKEPVMVKFTGETQGTYYAITYFDADARNFQRQVDSLLKDFDHSVSLWDSGSVLSAINRNEASVKPDVLFTELFNLSSEVYKKSGGAFDPTVGPLVKAWGFGFSGRMKVDQHIVDSLLPLVGFSKVTLEEGKIIKTDPRIQLDFNAIAQGYAVDLIAQFLSDKEIKNFLIDIGGEVLGMGNKPMGEKWKVGIEKPKDNANYGEGLQAIVNLENKALATSGNYRKFYEEDGMRYSHIIDPVSGYPAKHTLLSASVLAENCATADAYATVFMVLGLEKAKSFLSGRSNLEGFFIYTNETGELEIFFTEGFGKLMVEESE